MSDIINENGLQLKDLNTLIDDLTTKLKEIYGPDINTDSDSPDGQKIGIIAQLGTDLRELLALLNSSFDPDQAEGAILDQRVSINGIERNGGSYTITPIEIITSRNINLIGLDNQSEEEDPDVSNLFTVKDNEGNEFYLLDSVSITIPTTGDNLYNFRAAEKGKVETTINTITTPVTVFAGITSVNNPLSATTIGTEEETDELLKIRRRKSVAISASGYLDSIEAAISNVEGVTDVIVEENDTDATDINGIPAKSIWVIVEGGSDSDIAQAIWAKKSSGSGMYGDENVYITRSRNRTKLIKFDRVTPQDLYIRFSITFSGVYDQDFIKRSIVQNVLWTIRGDASADEIIAHVKSINNNYKITACELSIDNMTWAEIVSVSALKNKFVNDASRITIT